MQYKKLISDPLTVAQFIGATDGNWRNSIYVECSCKVEPRPEGCGDVLFSVASDGRAVLLPVPDAELIWGCRPLDKSECLLEMTSARLMAMCASWLSAGPINKAGCPIFAVIRSQVAESKW